MTVYKAKANFQNVPPKFKIFYENGSTYSNKVGPIYRAPKKGVVTILVETDNGKRIEKEHEFYCYFYYGWGGTNQSGLYNYLAEVGYKLVLFGCVIEKAKRDAICKAAMSDDYITG